MIFCHFLLCKEFYFETIPSNQPLPSYSLIRKLQFQFFFSFFFLLSLSFSVLQVFIFLSLIAVFYLPIVSRMLKFCFSSVKMSDHDPENISAVCAILLVLYFAICHVIVRRRCRCKKLPVKHADKKENQLLSLIFPKLIPFLF